MTKQFRSSIAYAIGNALNSAALFVLIPYLINALPPAAYGAWSLIEVSILVVTLFMTAGIEIGLMREYWFVKEDDQRRQLVGTALIAVFAWSVLLSILMAAILWLPGLPWSPAELLSVSKTSLTMLFVICIGEAGFLVCQTVLRIREQAFAFVVVSTTRLLLFVALVIGGVSLTGTIEGALAARVIAALVGFVIAAFAIRRFIGFAFHAEQCRRIVRYGLPLLPTGLASYILLASDRFMLQAFTSLEVVAIYTFAYKIATVLDVLVTRPFALDWAPRRFKIASMPHPEEQYARVAPLYLLVAGSFALLVFAATPLAYLWLAPASYNSGQTLVPLLLLAYIIYGLSYPLNIGIMVRDKTAYLPIISVFSGALCIGLNLWLIPAYGMLGAAWATIVAYLGWTGSLYFFSQRLYYVPYHSYDFLRVGLVLTLGLSGILLLDKLAAGLTPLALVLCKCIWLAIVLSPPLLSTLQLTPAALLQRGRSAWLALNTKHTMKID
jgi:O-antigen/teichoic acid export membrane protein